MPAMTGTASLADTTMPQPCSNGVVHVNTPAVGLAGFRAADASTIWETKIRQTPLSQGLTGGVI